MARFLLPEISMRGVKFGTMAPKTLRNLWCCWDFIYPLAGKVSFIFLPDRHKPPSGGESQFASVGLVGSSEVTRGGVVSVGWGLGHVDKSPDIDRIQKHLDIYIQADPLKAPNEDVRRERRRKLGVGW